MSIIFWIILFFAIGLIVNLIGAWYRKKRKEWEKICEEKGHDFDGAGKKPYYKHRKGLIPDYGTILDPCVAKSVTQRRKVCYRCLHEVGEWETIKETSIHSLSLPSKDMKKLEEEGFLAD